MSECQTPIGQVAKRLHLSYGFLRRVRKEGLYDADTAFKKRGQRGRFQKIHARAREHIQNLLETA